MQSHLLTILLYHEVLPMEVRSYVHQSTYLKIDQINNDDIFVTFRVVSHSYSQLYLDFVIMAAKT